MNKQKIKAFTLVELIVVITILAILGTIAFISLNGYSKTARDSARTSDLSTMKTSLELFNLDAGKYPNTTDSFNITYSGVTIWTQGEFGQTTTNNVDRLDKVPTDPLTETKYTYSITKTKQEYQLAGLLEGDDVALNLTEKVNAGTQVATAIVTGNYNGMMLKTLTGGVNCEILAVPSIISNQGTSGSDVLLGDIVTSSGFVYDRKNNLPSNYTSSKFKVVDGFNFSPNDLVVYSDSNSCKSIYDADVNTQRVELIENLQTAYSGTIIANEGTIAEITTADSGEIDALSSVIVNNNLGGTIVATTPNNCDESTKPLNNGHIDYINLPTSINQTYIKNNTECGYSCTDLYTGVNCETAPTNWNDGTSYFTYTTPYGHSIIVYNPVAVGLGSDIVFTWNKGTNARTYTSQTNTTDGSINTTNLSNSTDLGSPYKAADYCSNLNLGGATDWYLPAKDELNILYINKSTIGNFYGSGTCYHSSTENSNIHSWYQQFAAGGISSNVKLAGCYVRCIRKG